MVGLDAAGKTTILYKLKLGEIVTTIPTIGMFSFLSFVMHGNTHQSLNYSRICIVVFHALFITLMLFFSIMFT